MVFRFSCSTALTLGRTSNSGPRDPSLVDVILEHASEDRALHYAALIIACASPSSHQPPSSSSSSPSPSHLVLGLRSKMSFILRRPFAVSSNAFKQLGKPSSLIRSFHASSSKSSANTFFNPRPAASAQSLLKSSALRNGFKRGYQVPSYQPANPTASGNLTTRLLYGAALVGGTIVATNMIFNRETREDGGMPQYEREYLNQTFMHTGLGIGIIGVAASALHSSGWSYRLMATNPWLVIGLSLAASLGTMYGTFYTHPDK